MENKIKRGFGIFLLISMLIMVLNVTGISALGEVGTNFCGDNAELNCLGECAGNDGLIAFTSEDCCQCCSVGGTHEGGGSVCLNCAGTWDTCCNPGESPCVNAGTCCDDTDEVCTNVFEVADTLCQQVSGEETCGACKSGVGEKVPTDCLNEGKTECCFNFECYNADEAECCGYNSCGDSEAEDEHHWICDGSEPACNSVWEWVSSETGDYSCLPKFTDIDGTLYTEKQCGECNDHADCARIHGAGWHCCYGECYDATEKHCSGEEYLTLGGGEWSEGEGNWCENGYAICEGGFTGFPLGEPGDTNWEEACDTNGDGVSDTCCGGSNPFCVVKTKLEDGTCAGTPGIKPGEVRHVCAECEVDADCIDKGENFKCCRKTGGANICYDATKTSCCGNQNLPWCGTNDGCRHLSATDCCGDPCFKCDQDWWKCDSALKTLEELYPSSTGKPYPVKINKLMVRMPRISDNLRVCWFNVDKYLGREEGALNELVQDTKFLFFDPPSDGVGPPELIHQGELLQPSTDPTIGYAIIGTYGSGGPGVGGTVWKGGEFLDCPGKWFGWFNVGEAVNPNTVGEGNWVEVSTDQDGEGGGGGGGQIGDPPGGPGAPGGEPGGPGAPGDPPSIPSPEPPTEMCFITDTPSGELYVDMGGGFNFALREKIGVDLGLGGGIRVYPESSDVFPLLKFTGIRGPAAVGIQTDFEQIYYILEVDVLKAIEEFK